LQKSVGERKTETQKCNDMILLHFVFDWCKTVFYWQYNGKGEPVTYNCFSPRCSVSSHS